MAEWLSRFLSLCGCGDESPKRDPLPIFEYSDTVSLVSSTDLAGRSLSF